MIRLISIKFFLLFGSMLFSQQIFAQEKIKAFEKYSSSKMRKKPDKFYYMHPYPVFNFFTFSNFTNNGEVACLSKLKKDRKFVYIEVFGVDLDDTLICTLGNKLIGRKYAKSTFSKNNTGVVFKIPIDSKSILIAVDLMKQSSYSVEFYVNPKFDLIRLYFDMYNDVISLEHRSKKYSNRATLNPVSLIKRIKKGIGRERSK